MPPVKPNQPNPYASAAGAYSNNAQKNTNDPRELEARVLLKSAQFMQNLQNEWDDRPAEALEDILKYNRNIWMMFFDTAIENNDGVERPSELRNNIYNLSNFIFKRELDILARPEKGKLDVLIKINRDIANGLLASVRNAPSGGDAGQEQEQDEEQQVRPSASIDSST
ncbi:MAG: flagellar biosynthesis regulator FlaF [Micavibrio sp.]